MEFGWKPRRLNTEKSKQQAALKAALTTPPRIYKLIRSNGDTRPFRFFALGCQGAGNTLQKQVANLMAQIASEEMHKPDFILLLGDNIYRSGARRPNDRGFLSAFENIYCDLALPCFGILGNHDENLQAFALMLGGLQRGYNEVAYTYYHDPEGKQVLFANGELPLDKVNGWQIPSPFYGLDCGNTVIFCINSNHYVNDFLDTEINHDTNSYNQANWLKAEVNRAKTQGKQVILALHHPLFTTGRREYRTDFNLYFTSKAERERVLNYFMLKKQPSYNKLLRLIFEKQRLIFDAVLAAHDHSLSYYNNTDTESDYDDEEYPLRQFILGGGGGVLQRRLNFKDQGYLGCFLRRVGFGEIICEQNHIHAIIHSVNHPDLHFTTKHCRPLRHHPELSIEKLAIDTFCGVIKKGIDDYLSGFINVKQEKAGGKFFSPTYNITHGATGIERAHAIWTYISHYEVDDFTTTVSTVCKLATWQGKAWFGKPLTTPTPHSLINFINRRMQKAYGKSLEAFDLAVCPQDVPKVVMSYAH